MKNNIADNNHQITGSLLGTGTQKCGGVKHFGEHLHSPTPSVLKLGQLC